MSRSWFIGCKCSSSGFCQECSALEIWKIKAKLLREDGGFISIFMSELALQDYMVLMSKPVSYLFSEGTFF